MEYIRSFCHWVVAEGGAAWLVAVWFVVMAGQVTALSLHEKGRITDLALGRTLLAMRCFAASVFSFGSLILFAHAYFDGHTGYSLAGLVVGFLSVILWDGALRLGTAIPDRDCGPGG